MATDTTWELVTALHELGFSQYEAQCYVGLMAAEPQTGYRVAKVTGVPQPKVYEALRKLVSRGVVREVSGEPTLFSAIPPDALLQQLEDVFDRRLTEARESVRRLAATDLPPSLEYVERFADRDSVLRAATESLERATRRAYISASAAELTSLKGVVVAAVQRGVDVVVLAFGRPKVTLKGARVFHHASTEGALYRHHQAAHIALVVDSLETVNGVAADGTNWQAVRTSSEPVIAAVKGFIRHDIDLQQIFADFAPQLVEAYGPGLQALESYRQDQHRAAPEGRSSQEEPADTNRRPVAG